jgi:serine protease Do
MKPWKIAALTCGLVAAAGAGAAFVPVLHGQDRDIDVPVAQALDVFRGGSRIGVSIREINDEDAKQSKTGVMVDEVTSGSPADKAGIKSGDAIVEFDGERVRSVRQFTRLVEETPVGRKVATTVLRGGQRVTVSVTTERGSGFRFAQEWKLDRFGDLDRPFKIAPPQPPMPPAAPHPPSVAPALPGFSFLYRGGGRLGITIEDLSDGLSDYFGVKHGVLVRSVTDGSAGAKAGLKAGDVITSINGSQVEEPSDINRALDRLDDAADFTLEIMRDRKPQTLKGKLEAKSRPRARAIV